MATEATSKPTLVLHFDINKTIIICDPVKGVGCDAMLGALLSEVCWGTWDEDAWQKDAAGDKDAKNKAAETWKYQVGPTVSSQEGMVTYAELCEEVLKMEKADLQELKNSFTDPGHPGEAVRSSYQELQTQLTLPEGVLLPGVPDAVGAGRYFILPSFLRLITHLEKEGRDFRLVFRTFGKDLAEVISEFNLFCSGKHPCFPDIPAGLQKRAITLPQDSGEYYRDDLGLHLSLCSKMENGLELVQMIHGAKACADAVNDKLFRQSPPVLSMAIRDYYPFWREDHESDTSGKPLLVESPKEGATHHIFFDDNIERKRAHIVDARNAATGEPLPFSETQGLYLIKAEPILAIKHPDYFIDALGLAEQQMASRILLEPK